MSLNINVAISVGRGNKKQIMRDFKIKKGDSDPARWSPDNQPPDPQPPRPPSSHIICRHEVDHELEDEFHRQGLPKVRRPPRLLLKIPAPSHTFLPLPHRQTSDLSPIAEQPASPSPVEDEIYWSPSPSPTPMTMSSGPEQDVDISTDGRLLIDENQSRRSSEPSNLKEGTACKGLSIKTESEYQETPSGSKGTKHQVMCVALNTLLGDSKRPASPTIDDLPKVNQSHGGTSWEMVQILKACHHFNWNCFQQKVLKAHQESRSCSPTTQLLQLAAHPPTSPQRESEKQLRDKVQVLESEKKEMADRIANLHSEVLQMTDTIRSSVSRSNPTSTQSSATLPASSSTSLLRVSLNKDSALRWTSAPWDRPRYVTSGSRSSGFVQGAAPGTLMDTRGFNLVPPVGLADRQKELEVVVNNHQESLLRARAELDGRLPPDVQSKVTQLFPVPFELQPKPYQVISSNIKLYHITQMEVRNIEYRLALTYRIGVLLFECLKEDPLFVTLARMDTRCYEEQQHVLSTMLSEYMPVRNLALLTHFIKDKFGNVHSLSDAAMNIQIFSQISKFSYPIAQADDNDFSLDLLKVPRPPLFAPKGWFPPLAALPPQGALFQSMTTVHSSGRAPFDPFKYVAWVSAHNMAFGKALAGPLFDSASMSQVIPFIFQPSICTIEKGGPAEIFPSILRVLKLHCFNLASRIVDATLAKSYVSNANLTKTVFLQTNPANQTLFSDLIHDPFNVQFSGWPIPLWMETFGPQAKAPFVQQLIFLMQNSLFHISRPSSFSVDAWSTLRSSDGFNKAYSFVMQRERWIQSHLLTHEPLNFATSPYAQFVPTKSTFWIHYDH